jgi:hypothetical protein
MFGSLQDHFSSSTCSSEAGLIHFNIIGLGTEVCLWFISSCSVEDAEEGDTRLNDRFPFRGSHAAYTLLLLLLLAVIVVVGGRFAAAAAKKKKRCSGDTGANKNSEEEDDRYSCWALGCWCCLDCICILILITIVQQHGFINKHTGHHSR